MGPGLTMIEAMTEGATFCRNMQQEGLAVAIEQGINALRDGEARPETDGSDEISTPAALQREIATASAALREIDSDQQADSSTRAIARRALYANTSGEELLSLCYQALRAIVGKGDKSSESARAALEAMPKACLRFGS